MIECNYEVLHDDEIKLILSIGIPKRKQFYYIIYDINTFEKIGNCGIRLEENEDNIYLGNIEYEIFPEFQGHNYAMKATKLLSQIALDYEIINLNITANPTNLASIKTIEKLGAQFLEIKKVPKNMKLYQKSKEVAIYNWNILEKSK